jgi:hypothetical protein
MGIDIDLWVVTPAHVASRFKANISLLRCFAIGKVLFDTDDILRNLVYEARIRYSVGPNAQTSNQVAQLRHRVTRIMDDCIRFLETKTGSEAQFLMHTMLLSLLKIHCALQRMWCDDERELFENLRLRSPGVFALAEKFAVAASTAAWTQVLNELAEEILKNVGGPLKYFDCELYKQPTGIHMTPQDT